MAPGKVDPPKFDRAAFDVDFGQAYSGEQVRRTVVLNTSARGEAEFSLTIPNAPGFTITEVRVMGQGAAAPAPAAFATQMPMPSSGPRPLQDSAVRKVTTRVKAPPWKVQFNGPSEVQVDVLYAPTVDLFNNLIGKKMGVLNGAIRNAAGADGASIALRADFRGLKEVNAASLKPRDQPVFVVLSENASQVPFVARFDVASLKGSPLDGVLRQAANAPGIVLYDTPVRLPAGGSGIFVMKGYLSLAPSSNSANGVMRTVEIAMNWNGGSSRTSLDVIPVPELAVLTTGYMPNCGVQSTFVRFTYYFFNGQPYGIAYVNLKNNDKLRDATIFIEARAGGERVCWASMRMEGSQTVNGLGGFDAANDKSYHAAAAQCVRTTEAFVRAVRGPVEFSCQPIGCDSEITPEQCDALLKDRRDNPQKWIPR